MILKDIVSHLRFRFSGPKRISGILAVAGLAAIFLTTTSGCRKGPVLYDVVGTVTVDGSPAGGVNLTIFDASGSQAVSSATSADDGTFKFSTNMESGIAEGKYKVAAEWPDPSFKPKRSMMGGEGETAPDKLNGKYLKDKSDLAFEVTADTKETKIEMTTK